MLPILFTSTHVSVFLKVPKLVCWWKFSDYEMGLGADVLSEGEKENEGERKVIQRQTPSNISVPIDVSART